MSKHTSGPWLCHKIVGVYANTGELVASIHTPVSDRSHDAMLISAAPDLLASCMELLNCIQPGRDWDEAKRARAAIAKATGAA